jgi:hypothetical protein
MTTVVEPADPGRAPPSDVLRQVHRDLTAEAVVLLLAWDAPRAEMSRNRGFDLSQ